MMIDLSNNVSEPNTATIQAMRELQNGKGQRAENFVALLDKMEVLESDKAKILAGLKSHDETDFDKDLTLLQNPNIDIFTKNQLALTLSENRKIEVLPILIDLIKDPKNLNQRGTFVHCLQYFSADNWFNLAMDLVITGNFEVAHEVFLLVENIEYIQGDNIKKAFLMLNNNLMRKQWKLGERR